MQGLQEGGTERVVGAWVQGGGGRGAYFLSLSLLIIFHDSSSSSFAVIERI